MKIAIPVKNKEFAIFKNTGHTPFFAIFEIEKKGMFKTFSFVELRSNPRVNLDAEDGCSHEHGSEECDHDEEAHRQEHQVLGDLVADCDYVLAKKACKNSASVFKEKSVNIWKIPEGINSADRAIGAFLSDTQA